MHESNQSLALVDPSLTEFDENEALKLIGVALLCTQGSPLMRPTMSRVVGMLAGDMEVNHVISKPSYLTDWDFKDLTSAFSNQDSTQSVEAKTIKQNDDNNAEVEATHTPLNLTAPSLSDLIGEGR